MIKLHAATLLLTFSLIVTAVAQTTTFSYQGRLIASSQPYTGPVEVKFSVWDEPQAGNLLASTSPEAMSLSASDGLFMAELDFGTEPFAAGKERWLEIQLRTDLGAFTTLTPRQKLLATPYAMTAANLAGDLPAGQLTGTLSSAQLGGTYSEVLTLNNAGNNLTGNGGGLTGLNASQLTSGIVPDARLGAGIARTSNVWSLGGNAGTDPFSQFIGTSDATPLIIRAGGEGIMRLEGDLNGLRIIAGRGQILDGSSTNSAILSGRQNSIQGTAHESVIAGGLDNVIGPDQRSAFIGGGARNQILQDNQHAVIVGGRDNRIGTNSVISLVVGGAENRMGNNIDGGLMVGGFRNDILGSEDPSLRQIAPVLVGGSDNEIGRGRNSSWSVIVGGDNNRIGTNAVSAVIVGGTNNLVADNAAFSFAAGRRTRVNHQGAFVWADSQNASFASAGNDTFNIRAQGGVHLNSQTSQFFGSTTRQMLNLWSTVYGIGVQSSTMYFRSDDSYSWFRDGVHSNTQFSPGTGGVEMMRLNSTGLRVNGTFVSASDRDAKEDFRPVNRATVLEKVLALPLQEWAYKADAEKSRHLGPMAQDFKAAFGLGADDKHIATVDADGVALAAIQGLNQKVEREIAALRAENSVLREQNTELLRRLEAIEQRLR